MVLKLVFYLCIVPCFDNDLSTFTVPEIKEAFALEESTFEAKYGFPKPPKDIGDKLVVTCRSGRRVRLAIDELDNLGYSNLT